MVRGQWPETIDRLAVQLSQAEAADWRVEEAKSAGRGQRPNRNDLAPEEYQQQLHAYVQTPQYKATDRELRVAVALSKAHDAALLCAARKLLTRRADGKLPPVAYRSRASCPAATCPSGG